MNKTGWILILGIFATGQAFAGKPAQMPGMDAPSQEKVTVQGEAKDRVPLERVTPPTELPLKDAIPFTTQEEIENILKGEIEHLDPSEQVRLMNVRSPRPYTPTLVEFPKPPYFAMAYPFGSDSPAPATELKRWKFQVTDHTGETLFEREGASMPLETLSWDGYEGGAFKLTVDEVYTAVLTVETAQGSERTWTGDPVRLPVLKYAKGRDMVYEFSNRRLYQENRSAFKPEFSPYVEEVLNDLKRRSDPRGSITILDRDNQGSLSVSRGKLWQDTLSSSLLKAPESFSVKQEPWDDTGGITRVNVPLEGL